MARGIFLIACCTVCLGATVCRAEIPVRDDARNEVTIKQPARRIVAVAPHLAELVYAAGAGRWLIARVRGADYPPDVLALPGVGDAAGLDFERIRQLEPDLILAWGSGNKPADLSRLASGTVATFVMEPRYMRDIPRHLRIIGRLAGTQSVAENAAAYLEARLQQLRQRYSDDNTIDVFVEIWHQPLFTVGGSHLLSDALSVCGAHNALHDYPLAAGPVPLEDVLAADADVILSITGLPQDEVKASWGAYPRVSGRHSLRVISVEPDLLTRPGPRMLEGIEALCGQLDQVRDEWVRSEERMPVTSDE